VSVRPPPADARVREQARLGLLVGVVIAACDVVGYALHSPIAGVNAIWPAAGVLLAWLLLSRRRDWPVMLLAAVLANLAVDLWHGARPEVAVAGAMVNALESLVAAAVVARFGRRPFTLGSLRQVGALVIGAAVLSNAATAVLGSLVINGGSGARFWRGWLIWWVGDGLGMLVFAPVTLTIAWVMLKRPWPRPRAMVEPAILLLLAGVLTHGLLAAERQWTTELGGLEYAIFPLVIWLAVRHDLWASASAVAVIAVVVMFELTLVPEVAATSVLSPVPQIIHLYLFIALASLSALVPAAVTSERRTAMVHLEASEMRFRQMAEHIREAFVIADLDPPSVGYVSPTWAEIWGRGLEHAADIDAWLSTVHPDDRLVLERQAAIVRQGGEGAAVFRVRRPDDTVRWVRGRAFPVRDARGAVYRATGVFEDITELRQAEQRQYESQKMDALGRLAGGIAHDFNNMLTVIGSAAELLETSLPEDHEGREDIAAILQASASARGLTAQLMAFSRNEPVQPRQTAVHPLIEATATLVERLIGRHITLDCALAAADDVVHADPQQLEQVLVNLAINARDAMPDGGRMVFSTRIVTMSQQDASSWGERSRREYLCLSVSDTGIGMSSETLAHVFEPFYTTKAPGKGTGLGLATVFSIVQKSGGFVTVESEPGEGTTFEVHLPLADPRPRTIATREADAGQARRASARAD